MKPIDTEHIGQPIKPHEPKDFLVLDYFKRFAYALVSGDTKTIGALWGVPALALSDDGVQIVNSIREVEQFFAGAKEQYNSLGIVDTRPDILRLNWLTERLVCVEVRWPHIDRSGTVQGEEVSTYTLRLGDDGNLKMHIALIQGEVPKH